MKLITKDGVKEIPAKKATPVGKFWVSFEWTLNNGGFGCFSFQTPEGRDGWIKTNSDKIKVLKVGEG